MPRPVKPKSIAEHMETLSRMIRQIDADTTLTRPRKAKLRGLLIGVLREFSSDLRGARR
jgi:hypothetical protein